MKHLNIRWKLTLWYLGVLEWLHRRFAHHEGFDFEITDAGGQRIFVNPRLVERSLSFGEASPPTAMPRFETLDVANGGNWRVIGTEANGPDGLLTVRVGRSLASFEQEMHELLLTFLLTEVVSNMQLVAQEGEVALVLKVNEPWRLTGDRRQLRRVLYNLLDNAIKYTGAGGMVSVTSKSSNGKRVVVIADTGIGIPAEHLPRIFDRFYQVDPARSGEANGAGLGLSICRSIVRSTGGEISVESRLGIGTTVTVHFPEQSVSENALALPQGQM